MIKKKKGDGYLIYNSKQQMFLKTKKLMMSNRTVALLNLLLTKFCCDQTNPSSFPQLTILFGLKLSVFLISHSDH